MNARMLISYVVAALLLCSMTACANKGKLKSPSQIAAAEAKKERRAERKAAGMPAAPDDNDDDIDDNTYQSVPVDDVTRADQQNVPARPK